MDKPLLVEVIAYAPTAFYHCTHCEVAWREAGVTNRIHQEQLESSLPPDLLEDYVAVSDWVRELFSLYCDQVVVKVIDAASAEGLLKSLKYRTRRYPAVMIDGKRQPSNSSSKGASGSEMLQSASEEIRRLLEAGQPERRQDIAR